MYHSKGTDMVYIISHRPQKYCYIRGKNSKKQEVTCYIPQESCLRPHSLYNYFEKYLSAFYSIIYADDPSISSSNENSLQLLADLRMELEKIMDWLRQNKLSLANICFLVMTKN